MPAARSTWSTAKARLPSTAVVRVQTEVADLSSHPAVARLLRGASGVETLVRPSDEREYVYAYMPGRHGWDVVVEQPAAQAFAARDAQLRFVQFAYALTALFLPASAWLGMHELRGARRSLGRHAERLRMLHEIDRAVLAERDAGGRSPPR